MYLRSAGQRQQQVERGLGEEQVVFAAQADLHGAQHRRQDWDLPHHQHPVLTVLIVATQLFGQVQGEHAHLTEQGEKDNGAC